MKKLLPTKSGFTLIELLVVIAIIAVLAVVGIAIFTGQQKAARDARRRADIQSIGQAMEANYGKTTVGRYDALTATMFSSGVIPTDPTNTNSPAGSACPGVCKYCVREGAAVQTGAACSDLIAPTTSPYTPAITGGSANPYWMVCANLENPGTGPTFFCRGNAQ